MPIAIDNIIGGPSRGKQYHHLLHIVSFYGQVAIVDVLVMGTGHANCHCAEQRRQDGIDGYSI